MEIDYAHERKSYHPYRISCKLMYMHKTIDYYMNNCTILVKSYHVRHPAIICTSAGLFSIGPLGRNICELWIKILLFSFKNFVCTMVAILFGPRCAETVHWRHNESDGVSKKTSKFRATGLCEGNPPVNRWILLTKSQWREKCFHLMTSSWHKPLKHTPSSFQKPSSHICFWQRVPCFFSQPFGLQCLASNPQLWCLTQISPGL